MAVMLLKNTTKLGLAGGSVYWSIKQGVWGTTEEGSETMKKFATAIIPPSTEDQVKATPKNPQLPTESMVATAWNKGAKAGFQFAMTVPENVSYYGGQVFAYLEDSIQGKATDSPSK